MASSSAKGNWNSSRVLRSDDSSSKGWGREKEPSTGFRGGNRGRGGRPRANGRGGRGPSNRGGITRPAGESGTNHLTLKKA